MDLEEEVEVVEGALGEEVEEEEEVEEGAVSEVEVAEEQERTLALVVVGPLRLLLRCLSGACLNRREKREREKKTKCKTKQKKIFTFFSNEKIKIKKRVSLSLSLSLFPSLLSYHALPEGAAGTGAPTTLMSHSDATRDTKCASAVLVEAWTKKTSSASTGEYDPAPPAKKGFAVAFVSVLATNKPTVACRPSKVDASPARFT